MTSSVTSSRDAKKRQNLLLFGGGAGLFAAVVGLMALNDHNRPVQAVAAKATGTEQVAAAATKLNDKEVWMEKATAQMAEMAKANLVVSQQVTVMKQQNDGLVTQVQAQAAQIKNLQPAPFAGLAPGTASNPRLDALVPPMPGPPGQPGGHTGAAVLPPMTGMGGNGAHGMPQPPRLKGTAAALSTS